MIVTNIGQQPVKSVHKMIIYVSGDGTLKPTRPETHTKESKSYNIQRSSTRNW